jgi:outer membrane protein, heavy metal efflux system
MKMVTSINYCPGADYFGIMKPKIMNKGIIGLYATALMVLLSFGVKAQNVLIPQVLREIKQNNKELKAYEAYVKGKRLDLSAGNNLPDPQSSGYYLPFGDHSTPKYLELQISQSFEFPTVYAIRNNLIDLQAAQLELEYSRLEQEILLTATKLLQELVYLNKIKVVEQERVGQAFQVFQQVNALFQRGQVGILDLNKSKIAWMEEQFNIDQLNNKLQTTLLKLENLNGGQQITMGQFSYEDGFAIDPFDSIWNEKLTMEPFLISMGIIDNISVVQVKLAQNKGLPDLTLGYNQQGVSGSSYAGFYGGVAIPLWNNRNRVKSAKALHQFEQINREVNVKRYFTDLQGEYNKYQLMLQKYNEYQTVLDDLESESLLLDAYRLGEISFIGYYQELRFYRQAYDTMLEMELQLQQKKSEILKHRLAQQ